MNIIQEQFLKLCRDDLKSAKYLYEMWSDVITRDWILDNITSANFYSDVDSLKWITSLVPEYNNYQEIFIKACIYGEITTIQYIESLARPDKKCYKSEFSRAVSNGSLSVVKYFIQTQPQINFRKVLDDDLYVRNYNIPVARFLQKIWPDIVYAYHRGTFLYAAQSSSFSDFNWICKIWSNADISVEIDYVLRSCLLRLQASHLTLIIDLCKRDQIVDVVNIIYDHNLTKYDPYTSYLIRKHDIHQLKIKPEFQEHFDKLIAKVHDVPTPKSASKH